MSADQAGCNGKEDKRARRNGPAEALMDGSESLRGILGVEAVRAAAAHSPWKRK